MEFLLIKQLLNRRKVRTDLGTFTVKNNKIVFIPSEAMEQLNKLGVPMDDAAILAFLTEKASANV